MRLQKNLTLQVLLVLEVLDNFDQDIVEADDNSEEIFECDGVRVWVHVQVSPLLAVHENLYNMAVHVDRYNMAAL